jgi:hypothetical protein
MILLISVWLDSFQFHEFYRTEYYNETIICKTSSSDIISLSDSYRFSFVV